MCCTVALATLLAPTARAQEGSAEAIKLTEMTFSSPIQVPGVTLPAGTYTFRTSDAGEHIVQIFDKDRSKILASFEISPMTDSTQQTRPCSCSPNKRPVSLRR